MSSITVQQVSALNAKIEALNKKKTKADTQEEMLREQLSKQVKEYASTYGVSLEGKTTTETKELIKAEAKKQRDLVDSEYELKDKVIKLIEEGDIAGANRLLGIEVAESEELAVENEEAVEEISESEEEEEELLIPKAKKSAPKIKVPVEEEELPIAKPKGMSPLHEAISGLTLEEEDDSEEDDVFSMDDEDFGFGEMLAGSKLALD